MLRDIILQNRLVEAGIWPLLKPQLLASSTARGASDAA